MRPREKLGFALLIVTTSMISGWGFVRFGSCRTPKTIAGERIPPARYINYFFRGGEKGGVPADFCSAASKAIPATVRIRAYSGRSDVTSGSGAVLTEDGYIVTNNHVIEGADDIRIGLSNRKELKATLVGADPDFDIAVIKVDAKNLPILLFGNSSELKVGQWVLAVGFPFYLQSTVTAGIVSAQGKGLVSGRHDRLETFIQTDAVVNVGNSGGPLVNPFGEIVGINTAMATSTGFYTGYSFAIPANIVRKVVIKIMAHARAKKG